MIASLCDEKGKVSIQTACSHGDDVLYIGKTRFGNIVKKYLEEAVGFRVEKHHEANTKFNKAIVEREKIVYKITRVPD